jgi:hypothetical protein
MRGVVLFNCAGGMTSFRYEELPWFLRPLLYVAQNYILKGRYGKTFFQNFKTRDNVESILQTQGVYRDQTNVDDQLLEILLGPSDDAGAEDVFLKVFGGPPGPTPEALLPFVECPILALWGDADPWTPLETGMHPGSKFGDYNSNIQIVPLPNTGHCPHVSYVMLCYVMLCCYSSSASVRCGHDKQHHNQSILILSFLLSFFLAFFHSLTSTQTHVTQPYTGRTTGIMSRVHDAVAANAVRCQGQRLFSLD